MPKGIKKSILCSKCNERKYPNEMKKDKKRKSGLSSWCKKCHSLRECSRGGNDSLRRRKDALKQKYGITIELYNDLFQYQNGCCAICGKHQEYEKKSLAVDHNHKTGEVRGLLCAYCNTRLSILEDKFWIKSAKQYLG